MAFIAIDADLLVGIADIGDHECGGEFHVLEFEGSVQAGNEALIRTFDEDACAHERFPIFIDDNSGQLGGLCLWRALADGNALSVDDVAYLLAGKDLVQHVRDRSSGSIDADHLVEIHVAGIDGYGVSLSPVQCGNRIANLHILQRQVDLSIRADADQQGSERQKNRFE